MNIKFIDLYKFEEHIRKKCPPPLLIYISIEEISPRCIMNFKYVPKLSVTDIAATYSYIGHGIEVSDEKVAKTRAYSDAYKTALEIAHHLSENGIEARINCLSLDNAERTLTAYEQKLCRMYQ